MSSLKIPLFISFLLAMVATGHAQMSRDNTRWTFEAKKKTGNQYDLIIHAGMEKGWHIYAMKPGGDGSLIVPSFSFDKNAKVKLTGNVKEKGKLISKVLIPGDPKINMYVGSVDYIQQATITGTGAVTGEYTYQICNDNTCRRPQQKR